MSAFHPAVYGALYVALADHKRYLAAAEAVADMYGAGDAIAEYTSAIAGLQEMIALLHAGDADAAVDDRLIAEADLGPMHCMLHTTPSIPPGEHCPECKADFDAADEALAQDEDQPATPARGHGQDDEQQLHTRERVDEDLVICIQCTAAQGAQILWPCLRKSALDVADDFGNTSPTAPATGERP